MKSIILVLLVISLTGCASIINKSHQEVRIQAKSPDGQPVSDAQCTLQNPRETVQTASDGVAHVHRSGDDLHIQCKHPVYPDANARAVSRVNKEMAGNAFFLFGLGSILDHRLGKGYTYPTWIQPVFGQHLIFDRRDEENGKPVPARRDDRATL